MKTDGRRTSYEPSDYPVARWAQDMARTFERDRRLRAEQQAKERKEDECDRRQK